MGIFDLDELRRGADYTQAKGEAPAPAARRGGLSALPHVLAPVVPKNRRGISDRFRESGIDSTSGIRSRGRVSNRNGSVSPQENAMRKAKYRFGVTLVGITMFGGLLIVTSGPSRAEIVKLQA